MIDYSAGEISTEEARELILFLDGKLSSEGVRLYPGFFLSALSCAQTMQRRARS